METTGEDDNGEFCVQIGIGQGACTDTTHAYRERDIFGHEIDKA